MKVLALLDIDEEQLSKFDSNFENEMGWVAQSGIYLVDSVTTTLEGFLDLYDENGKIVLDRTNTMC